MSAPILKSVKREEQERDGFSSFREWVEAPNHIYIRHNIKKYLNDFNKKDSIWCNPFITFDVSREEKKYYENFPRCNPHLIEKLHELENKFLGCWCANSKLCHGSILIKLYHEKYGEEKDGYFEKKGRERRLMISKKEAGNIMQLKKCRNRFSF